MSPGPPPDYADSLFTSAHTLRGVVDHLQRTEATLANALIAIRKAVDTELDLFVDALRSEAASADEELRQGLRCVLAGGVRDRGFGAALLAAGIVLSVAGSKDLPRRIAV